MRTELLGLNLVSTVKKVLGEQFNPYTPPNLPENLLEFATVDCWPQSERKREVSRQALAMMAILACDVRFRRLLFKADRTLKQVGIHRIRLH